MLDVRGIGAGYGKAAVLFDVSLAVGDGEGVALLGRNGAGKSTTLKAIAGWLPIHHGEIRLDGRRIDGAPSYSIARAGLGYVPEGRRIFTGLTVLQNLAVGSREPRRQAPWTPPRLFALFPRLAELQTRRGAEISGGEQQMLAIARTLMGNPTLLLLDEPGEGLAPLIVAQLAAALRELKRDGVAILLAEQSLALAGAIADRAVVLESGQVRYAGPYREFAADAAARAEYLGLD
ncbi:MAG TPA: ABC transporter ATP-binding protein [Casimicrobiaceae bacterium]|nr:ABC transporter ATP-binding protein [Casimicrobiaceae bacterium]